MKQWWELGWYECTRDRPREIVMGPSSGFGVGKVPNRLCMTRPETITAEITWAVCEEMKSSSYSGAGRWVELTGSSDLNSNHCTYLKSLGLSHKGSKGSSKTSLSIIRDDKRAV